MGPPREGAPILASGPGPPPRLGSRRPGPRGRPGAQLRVTVRAQPARAGTTDPGSIGKSVSNGCIRMRNIDVIDLYNRTKLGTKVVVK